MPPIVSRGLIDLRTKSRPTIEPTFTNGVLGERKPPFGHFEEKAEI